MDRTPRPPARPDLDGMVPRRVVLLGGAAAAALAITGCSGSASEPAAAGRTTAGAPSTSAPRSTTTVPAACELSPELTAGPYHLDDPAVRSDIREDRPGAPLTFAVTVLSYPGCYPLKGALVDVWHCDAGGEYSGFNGNSLQETTEQGTNAKRFLRGIQRTDATGTATFETIFPGWYEGRTVHVHLQVVTDEEAGRDGRAHTAHVGQAFFDEADTTAILGAAPYSGHTGARTTNDQDSIYRQAGPNAMVALTAVGPDDAAAGWKGRFTCIVDPTATPPPAPLF
ncbi:MAG TPA: intradiol ring-cleavage dioxygenase [Acidimicrobiales bacterium]|nr:intradiol ring-cleavage dioxygenase [Acidimicrobiales bacterium]